MAQHPTKSPPNPVRKQPPAAPCTYQKIRQRPLRISSITLDKEKFLRLENDQSEMVQSAQDQPGLMNCFRLAGVIKILESLAIFTCLMMHRIGATGSQVWMVQFRLGGHSPFFWPVPRAQKSNQKTASSSRPCCDSHFPPGTATYPALYKDGSPI